MEYECKFCFESGGNSDDFISPCCCTGSMMHVHKTCLNSWLITKKGSKEYDQCCECHCKYRRDEPEDMTDEINKTINIVSLSGVLIISSLLVGAIILTGISKTICSIVLLIIYFINIGFCINYYGNNNSVLVYFCIFILFCGSYSKYKTKLIVTNLWLILTYIVLMDVIFRRGYDQLYRSVRGDLLTEQKIGMYDNFTNNFVEGII